MRNRRLKVIFAALAMALSVSSMTQAANVWSVDAKGNITLNGKIFRVKGGSWFGLEGRHEPHNDQVNPNGAPMEMFIGNMFWSPSGRTLAGTAAEIKSLGFNSIRLPVSPQTLSDSDPQGRSPNLKNHESVRIEGALSALKAVIKACADVGLYVLLDLHSCSNYVGWRAGRIDARPPYVDGTRDNYHFKREDCSCASTGNPPGVTRIQAYDEAKWLADLKTLAGLGAQIGVDNIMGIDIFNEPWDYSWSEWRALIDKAYAAISSVNPNILIYAQGIGGSNGNQDGTSLTKFDTPHGDPATNPNWGENLFEVRFNPPSMPKNKLVFSPHCYGPSVCTQPMFADLTAQPQCAGLVEDAFGNAKCKVVIKAENLEPGWEEHFGYLKDLGYAIAIGEYGGNMDWPNKSEARHQTRYSYLTDKTTDEQWQNVFVDWLIKKKIFDFFYWSINPESADTYGIFRSPYDPISNTAGWGSWSGTDPRKIALLNRYWNAAAASDASTTVPYALEKAAAPKTFSCSVSRTGMITYSLPKEGMVSLKLYNLNGRLQAELPVQRQAAGSYSVDSRKLTSAAGSYMMVLNGGDNVHKQMVYVTK